MMNLFKRRVGPWRRYFAVLPMEITYGPGKGKEVWFRWYYARWRNFFGAHITDRAHEPID